jgi:hypothetical protein
MKIKIFLIFLILNWIECLEVKDFCYKYRTKRKEFECNGDFSHYCGNKMCTKDENNCKIIALYYFFPNTLNEYIRQIKYCPKPIETHKWNRNDVCLNQKNCLYSSVAIWSSQSLVRRECDCTGKYYFKCNINDYCGLDEKACNEFYINKSILKIKKC